MGFARSPGYPNRTTGHLPSRAATPAWPTIQRYAASAEEFSFPAANRLSSYECRSGRFPQLIGRRRRDRRRPSPNRPWRKSRVPAARRSERQGLRQSALAARIGPMQKRRLRAAFGGAFLAPSLLQLERSALRCRTKQSACAFAVGGILGMWGRTKPLIVRASRRTCRR